MLNIFQHTIHWHNRKPYKAVAGVEEGLDDVADRNLQLNVARKFASLCRFEDKRFYDVTNKLWILQLWV